MTRGLIMAACAALSHWRTRPAAIQEEQVMRSRRSVLVGATTLMLLAGSVGQGLAQADPATEADLMAPGHFTGTWSEQLSGVGPELYDWLPGSGYYEALDNESVAVFSADDPRISGTFIQVLNIRSFPIDPEVGDFAMVWTAAVRIENDGGAWTGGFDGFGTASMPVEWYQLEGEGAYDGLTATMRWLGDTEAFEGIIVPGSQPDRPAPVAASAE